MHALSLPRRKKQPSPLEQAQKQLTDDLWETKRRLDVARNFFERVSDPELVAASVYEINSLQAKYSYLLHQVKKNAG